MWAVTRKVPLNTVAEVDGVLEWIVIIFFSIRCLKTISNARFRKNPLGFLGIRFDLLP